MPLRADAAPPRRLSDCISIGDLRALARKRLPEPIFGYMDGGAETEATMRRNTSGFDDLAIVPRVLKDVADIDLKTRVLGAELDWPVLCSPTGASRFYHPDGELAVARAAAKAGVMYSLSTISTHSLEAVADETSGPKMFQLYVFKDRGLTGELINRARAAGYTALCVTVDAAARGKRERELRSGMGVPLKLKAKGYLSFALHPAWAWGQVRRGPLSMPNFASATGSRNLVAQTRFVGAQLDAAVTWDDLDQFARQWGGPFAVKGVIAPDDARASTEHGATAIIVSNHGGRQLDGGLAAIDALPNIVEAVDGKAEIILDGGVRRGVHVLKALAAGAKACSVGRPYLYGLAAGGEAGVSVALDILREELIGAMRLAGCASLSKARRVEIRRLR